MQRATPSMPPTRQLGEPADVTRIIALQRALDVGEQLPLTLG
jgi:hypothetical protein